MLPQPSVITYRNLIQVVTGDLGHSAHLLEDWTSRLFDLEPDRTEFMEIVSILTRNSVNFSNFD